MAVSLKGLDKNKYLINITYNIFFKPGPGRSSLL